jgi:WD40 repeat protein
MPDGGGLVFSSNCTGALTWSLWKIALTGGEPDPLAGVSGGGAMTLSVARLGSRLVYEQSLRDLNIYRIPRPGLDWRNDLKNEPQPIPLIPSTVAQVDPQFSPDGRKIAYSTYAEIWTCTVDGANKIQLTDLGAQDVGSPRWSPDGTHIAFDSQGNGMEQIYIVPARGGLPRLLISESSACLPSWSRDGQWIYFASHRTGD